MSLNIEIAIEAPEWAVLGDPHLLALRTFTAALEETGAVLAPGAEVSVVFSNDAAMRTLNRQWRKMDKPTNVLSFPAPGRISEAPLLGDIVVSYETAKREAALEGKTLADHTAHLLAHGFLHLLGHDHEEAAEAEAMEAIERAVLARLGIADPYRGPPQGRSGDPLPMSR